MSRTRSQSEIIAAQEEFFDRVWHERHLVHLMKHEETAPHEGDVSTILAAAPVP
jgi:hypothetical protein